MSNRTLLIAAACALWLGGLSALAGEAGPDKGEGQGPGEALASASRVAGTVEFCRGGASTFAALAQDGALFKGDTVRTGKKSSVELKLSDRSHLSLGEESTLVLREVRGKAQADRTLLDLDEGSLGAAVEKLGERQRFEISTPVAVCGVRGTRLALRHTNPAGGPKDKDRGKTLLTVGSGKVNADCRNIIFAGKGGMDVGKGQSLLITWDGFGKLGDVGAGGFKNVMKTLPGWHPDPADPNLSNLQVFSGDPGIGLPGGWWNRGARDGLGAFDRGRSGFSNGVQGAITGSLGLPTGNLGKGGSGAQGNAGAGAQANAGPGALGNAGPQGGAPGVPPGAANNLFNSAGGVMGGVMGGANQILPGLVRPGQPTQLPYTPPPPPPEQPPLGT